MIKQVSINRFEGNGIIERIEGNGWDIDAECIELNGINARIEERLENRIISLDGPAVEDLFKSLRDLLKENSGLRETIEEKNERIKTLNREVRDKDIEIERLNNSLSNYYELYEKYRVLENKVRNKNVEIERLNRKLERYDEIVDKNVRLENKLKLADKWNPIKDFIREATGEDFDFAVKTFLNFIPDYEVTVSVSKQEDDDND